MGPGTKQLREAAYVQKGQRFILADGFRGLGPGRVTSRGQGHAHLSGPEAEGGGMLLGSMPLWRAASGTLSAQEICFLQLCCVRGQTAAPWAGQRAGPRTAPRVPLLGLPSGLSPTAVIVFLDVKGCTGTESPSQPTLGGGPGSIFCHDPTRPPTITCSVAVTLSPGTGVLAHRSSRLRGIPLASWSSTVDGQPC